MENKPQTESLEEKLTRLENENKKKDEEIARLESENKQKDEKIEMHEEAHRLMIEQNEKLSQKAYSDPLTGLKNRHSLDESIKLVFRQRKEDGPERREVKKGQEDNVCTIMIDIDHFKKVNDTYGHDAGDEILKGVAQRLEGSIRETDVIARYGGEEFIIMLFEASEFEAQKKAERLRKLIEENPFDFNGQSIPVTISVGVSFGDKNSDPDLLKREADTALYNSKNSGRNIVTVYSTSS